MKHRIAALSLAGALGLTAVSGGVANAQDETVEIFNAQAQATALQLSVLGNDLLNSTVSANLKGLDNPLAEATASHMLTPAVTGDAAAKVVGQDGTQTDQAESCGLGGLDAVPGLARIYDATCPTAAAEIAAGLPSADAIGTQLKLDVSVSEILDTLGLRDTIAGDHDAGNDGLDDTVLDSLTPITEQLSGTPVGELVDDTVVSVDDLTEDVLGLDTTVRLAVAPALADVVATAESVTAHARAEGLRIELLPVNDPGKFDGILQDLSVGDPLLTITVSEAEGSQTYMRGAEAPEPAVADSSFVKIKIGPGLPILDEQVIPLLQDLGLGDVLAAATGAVQSIPGLESAEVSADGREIVIKGPGTFTLLEGTPLETTVVLSGVDTSTGFSATGAKVHALKGVEGGILASLSDIAGGDAGDIEVLSGVVEEPRELARTGATPWIPLAGMVLLGLAIGSRRLVLARIED